MESASLASFEDRFPGGKRKPGAFCSPRKVFRSQKASAVGCHDPGCWPALTRVSRPIPGIGSARSQSTSNRHPSPAAGGHTEHPLTQGRSVLATLILETMLEDGDPCNARRGHNPQVQGENSAHAIFGMFSVQRQQDLGGVPITVRTRSPGATGTMQR